MKKLSLLIALAAMLCYAVPTSARICFLADTECQDGSFTKPNTGKPTCSPEFNVTLSEKCNAKNYDKCAYDNLWQDKGCKSGYCDLSTVLNQSDYTCNTGSCDTCCKDPTCNPDKYFKCDKSKHDLTVSGIRTCKNLDNNCNEKTEEVFYSRCVCKPEFDIEYSRCNKTGLTPGSSCEDTERGLLLNSCACDNNKGYFTSCDYGDDGQVAGPNGLVCYKCKNKPTCKAGTYSADGSLANCSNGVEVLETLPDNGGYCVKCKEKPTEEPQVCTAGKTDFDAFWKGYFAEPSTLTPVKTCPAGSGKIEYDCVALGYPTSGVQSGTKCDDGTEPYRCPFDHTMVYCPEIEETPTIPEPTPTTCPSGQVTVAECKAQGKMCIGEVDGCCASCTGLAGGITAAGCEAYCSDFVTKEEASKQCPALAGAMDRCICKIVASGSLADRCNK